MDGFNELDDMGTGWEEAAEREYERREEAGVEAWRVRDAYARIVAAALFAAPIPCACETAGTIEAADALLSGECRACGWRA
jgi:hypothetical protein